MTAREALDQLREVGYTVMADVLEPERLATLRDAVERCYRAEGENAGREFRQEQGARRLANLMNKGNEFHSLVVEPRVRPLVESVLGPEYKLSSLNARTANPRNGIAQPLHADMGAIADDRGYWVCNCVWLLDDFTRQNGTLRVVPGSHRWRKLPRMCWPSRPNGTPMRSSLRQRRGR